MAVDDFEDLLEEFGNEYDLPSARHLGDTIEGGVVTASQWVARTLSVSAVFPYTPREQREDVDGIRATGEIVIYAQPGQLEAVRIRAEGVRGDVVQWNGQLWQIYKRNAWGTSGSGFEELMADRLDTTHTVIASWIASEQGGGNASP